MAAPLQTATASPLQTPSEAPPAQATVAMPAQASVATPAEIAPTASPPAAAAGQDVGRYWPFALMVAGLAGVGFVLWRRQS
jgi:hypothetical protein